MGHGLLLVTNSGVNRPARYPWGSVGLGTDTAVEPRQPDAVGLEVVAGVRGSHVRAGYGRRDSPAPGSWNRPDRHAVRSETRAAHRARTPARRRLAAHAPDRPQTAPTARESAPACRTGVSSGLPDAHPSASDPV